MEPGFVVPIAIKAVMCKCRNPISKWNKVKGCETCKTCGLYARFLLRSCSGCGSTFIYNFYHPAMCWKVPLCWSCLNDSLCEDLLCYEHEHFLSYFYDAEYKGTAWQESIRLPLFEQPVLIDTSNFKFDFEVV